MNVEDLIAAYAQAFEARDPKAVAALYAYPAHVTSDLGQEVRRVALPSAEVFEPMLAGLMEKYRKDGVKKIRAAAVEVTELSSRLRQVAVHWQLLGLADLPLYDFDNVYLAARLEQGWRIVSAVSPNELQRYRAFIGRG